MFFTSDHPNTLHQANHKGPYPPCQEIALGMVELLASGLDPYESQGKILSLWT